MAKSNGFPIHEWYVIQEFATFDLELVGLPSSPISSTQQPTTSATSVWKVHCARVSVGVIGVQATWRGRVMRRCCVFVWIVSLLLRILSSFRLSATPQTLMRQLRMVIWMWRSAERRVGKAWFSTCRTCGSPVN